MIKEFAMKLAPAHNFSIYEHVTFYENVEVGPPTKSNRGAPNETVTSLVDKPLVCDAWPVQRQTYGYLPSRRVSSSTVHTSAITHPVFTNYSVHVGLSNVRGSVFLWRRCDTLRTSGFMDDVTFVHNSQ